MRFARIIAATAVGVAALSLFLFSNEIFRWLARIQFGPNLADCCANLALGAAANLLFAIAVLLLILALTALFGRVYCSVLCPFGILQDALIGLFRLARRRKFRFRPSRGFRWWHYGIALAALGALAAGWNLLFARIEPYTNFGIIASGVGRTLYIKGHNALVPDWPIALSPQWKYQLAAGLLLLLALAILCFFRGRLFCNLLCPTGAALRLAARHSVFRMRLDANACVKCQRCTHVCPAECIDLTTKTIDVERCVVCGDCAAACPKHALHYNMAPRAASTPAPSAPARREFLGVALAGAGGVLLGLKLKPDVSEKTEDPYETPMELPILPPGAGSHARFAARCTGCQLCVAHCTGKVLRSAPGGRVELKFEQGMCEFSCRKCSLYCPTGAIRLLSLKEKRRTRIGLAEITLDRCVAFKENTECGACAEHCPTGALQMKDRPTGARIPALTEALCIGCGNCEHPCPVAAPRAIRVRGIATQVLAEDPESHFNHAVKTPTPISPGDDWAF